MIFEEFEDFPVMLIRVKSKAIPDSDSECFINPLRTIHFTCPWQNTRQDKTTQGNTMMRDRDIHS